MDTMTRRRLDSLLEKLHKWLMEQPEYVHLLTHGGRGERRQACRELARSLFTIPRVGGK